MNIKSAIKKFSNSSLGYMPIKIMDGILGVVMLKVYTHLFSPYNFGKYNVINPTILIIYMLSLGWLNKSTTYFSSQYSKNEEDKGKFFTCMFLTWGGILVGLFVLFTLYHFIFPPVLDNQTLTVTWILFFFLIGYSMNQILITLLLYLDLKTISNVLLLMGAAVKIALTYVLHSIMGEDIITIFISHAVVDILTGMISMIAMKAFKYIHLRNFSMDVFKIFFSYGYPLIGLGLVSSLLNMSDRFIIEYFFDSAEVGFYTANYTIASSIFTMIMMGMNRGIYPSLLKSWADGNIKAVEDKLSEGTKYFLMISIPAALGLLLMSYPIAKVFIDQKYLDGHHVIGIVAFGYLFMGLTEYANKGWEITGKTIYIFWHCLVGMVVNLILNVIFVPIFGYITAAYTTVIAFFIYFMVSFVRRNRTIRWYLKPRTMVNLVIANAMMAITVLILKNYFATTIIDMLIVIFAAVVVYFATLYFTGEIKQELRNIRR